MSHRKFSDRSGAVWEVRIRAKGDWEFRPVPGNPQPIHHGSPPHWARDPFELSEQELWTLLGDATPSGPRHEPTKSEGPIFGGGSGNAFFDEYEPPKPKSPFLDDQD